MRRSPHLLLEPQSARPARRAQLMEHYMQPARAPRSGWGVPGTKNGRDLTTIRFGFGRPKELCALCAQGSVLCAQGIALTELQQVLTGVDARQLIGTLELELELESFIQTPVANATWVKTSSNLRPGHTDSWSWSHGQLASLDEVLITINFSRSFFR